MDAAQSLESTLTHLYKDNYEWTEQLLGTMKQDKPNILYVDDEVNNLASFKATFRRDFNVFIADSAAKGTEILRNNKIHIIVTDQRMPEMTGVQFLESIITDFPDPIRILLTGYADMGAVVDAINKGQVYKYMTKPWSEDDIRVTLQNAHEVYTLREENKELTKQLLKMNEQLEFLLRQHLLS